MSTKLSDAQRVILAAAAARDSGLVLPIPDSVRGNEGTFGIILKSLLARGLIAERPVLADEIVWHDKAGAGGTTLVISADGLRELGVEPDHSASVDDIPREDSSRPSSTREGSGVSDGREVDFQPSSQLKIGSKLHALIAALNRPEGATIADLMAETCWQAHSVRGAISGNLKKKLKLQVTSEAVEGRGRVYRIAGEAVA
jgi:hypothetical protein